MDIEKIKKKVQTDTLQIRLDAALKQNFIYVCEAGDYSYSAVLREMIIDFISNRYININDSTFWELRELSRHYNLPIDDMVLKIINDRFNKDIIQVNNNNKTD